MQLSIRRMTEDDLDAVLAIEAVSVPVPWSRASYENEIHNQWAACFVCLDGETLIGYCDVWSVFEEANIQTIVVASSCRRSGAGRLMMETMEEEAKRRGAQRIMLEVRPSNLPALALYRGRGYMEIARRAAYYPDNQEDALILCKYADLNLEGAVLL